MFVNEGHASGGVPIMVHTVGSETGSAESVTAEFLVNDYLGTTLASVGAESSSEVEGTLVASLGIGQIVQQVENKSVIFLICTATLAASALSWMLVKEERVGQGEAQHAPAAGH